MKLSELKPGDSFIRRFDVEEILRLGGDSILVYTKVRTAGTTNDQLLIRGRELVGIRLDSEEVIQVLSK